MASQDLVQLHVHSEYSILDGCGKQDDYIARAKDLGMPAVCFTEHGSLRGIHKLHENASAIGGIRPIYGIEFYLCHDHSVKGLPENELAMIRATFKSKMQQNKAAREREQQLDIRRRFHTTVLARNNTGLRNLYKLSSIGWTDGFYIRPRIDLALLERYGDGLIVLSGCLDGFASNALLDDRYSDALAYAERFRERWGDDFYLEIMPNSLEQQVKVNAGIVRIHRETGIPLVATADCHYIMEADWEAHEVLLCVNTKRKMSDPNRWTFGTRDFWYQSRQEMQTNFKRHHPDLEPSQIKQALDETVRIAEKCKAHLDVDRFRALVPALDVPTQYGDNEFKWLLDLCMTGWETRGIEKRAVTLAARRSIESEDALEEYAERLKLELKQIKAQKVVRYFLIIWDLYEWVKTRGITCGPGRGSAGGSLVAYLLGIVNVDPVEHGLIFERFLNPDRIDLPDIDCDFEDRRRGEIVDYLRQRYGEDKVAQISTVSRMTGKACLRDMARVLDIPSGEIDAVVSSIVLRSSGDERESQTIEDAMVEFKVGREFNDKHPDVMRYAGRLEGQARGLGLHAAGVIVSRDDLTEWIPLESRDHDGERIACTGVDMWGAEAMGLLKIDVLGLRTLSVISDCLQAIERRHGETIDLDWISLDDPKVLGQFTEGRFVGVFQFDTTSAEKICEGVTFDRFDDIPAMVALDRPGTARSGLATEYLKRKADPSKRVSIHPILDKICEDTLGIIVYQEHVIKIFTEVAGFAPGTADSLRKLIAKKWGEEKLGKERVNFIEGAASRGFPRDLAENIMDKITFFGSYGFNKSHATAYGLISYWQMWLKTYYPIEFMWGLLANEPDRQRIMRLIRETNRLGIDVLQPDVSESQTTFSISGDAIRSGLVDLKGVGSAAVKSITENQPFTSFADFIERIELRKVHKGVITSLVKAGAMESLVPNARWFLDNVEELWGSRSKAGWIENVVQQLEESSSAPGFDKDERTLVAAEVSPLAFGRHPIEPHYEFLDALPVEWATTAGEDIWEMQWAWVRGTMVEIRYNQVGDFHTGKEPSDQEKRRMKWGARYANINVEDASGVNKRVKVNHDIFDDVRSIVDKGVGVPLAILVSVNKRWKGLRTRILLDITSLRRKLAEGGQLTASELALVDPARLFIGHKRDDLVRKLMRKKAGVAKGVALVTSVENKLDKNLNEMAFTFLYGRGGGVSALCFASAWPDVRRIVRPGNLVRATIRVDRGSYFIEAAELAQSAP
jgi:DNA polymerase-3 subunit alpha